MYLLDTHTFIWTLGNDENLSQNALNIIHSQSEIFVSMATFWEIAIKQSIKKFNIEDSIEDLGRICKRLSIKILPIELRHIERTKHCRKSTETHLTVCSSPKRKSKT